MLTILKQSLFIIAAFALTGCADKVTFQQAAELAPVGFWYGVWHGFLLTISLIWSIFDDSVAIYAIYNNGGWYNFGYWVGVSLLTTTLVNKR